MLIMKSVVNEPVSEVEMGRNDILIDLLSNLTSLFFCGLCLRIGDSGLFTWISLTVLSLGLI